VLPCWLNERAFKALARSADGFVLQVHSLEQPKGPEDPITLCDSKAAVRWVEKAARMGVAFRVALPTYGYLVAFNKEGRFIGLTAEGRTHTWDEGTILRTVSAEPVAMAKLVQGWQEDRPCTMQGVIWYRLPVETDSLNWKWVTLSAIMAGRIPRKGLRVEVEYPEPELAEIVLVNDGETDQSAGVSIEIGCGGEDIIAADGLRGYVVTRIDSANIRLEHHGEKIFSTIRAGERWKIGWIRLKQEMLDSRRFPHREGGIVSRRQLQMWRTLKKRWLRRVSPGGNEQRLWLNIGPYVRLCLILCRPETTGVSRR